MAVVGFADEVAAQTRTSGIKCRLCVQLESLDKKDREEIELVMLDQSFDGEAIARALTARGIETRGDRVRKHRRNCIVR